MSASRYQVEAPKDKQTRSRPMPLPFTIDALVQGKYYSGRQYLGHGLSKVCYWHTDTIVLKLSEERNQEPELFQDLQASGMYPVVHASGQCRVEDPDFYDFLVPPPLVPKPSPLPHSWKLSSAFARSHSGVERWYNVKYIVYNILYTV